jgi:hypothetical protein
MVTTSVKDRVRATLCWARSPRDRPSARRVRSRRTPTTA